MAELNLIRNSWFTSSRSGSFIGQHTRPEIYNAGANATMERLIYKFQPLVASLDAVPDEVVGWICRELARPVTHYVYVKHAFRRLGIASVLAHGTLEHSHQTKSGDALFGKLGSLYNPFLLGVFDGSV